MAKEAVIEYLHADVTLERLHGGKLLAFKIHSTNRQAIDVYIDSIIALMQEKHTAGETWFALQDVTAAMLSPYVRKRAEDSAKASRNLKNRGYFAVLVADTLFGKAMSIFINRSINLNTSPHLKGKCFTSRAEALAWLEEKL